MCGTYIWGEGSPVYNTVNVDLFDILANDLFTYDSLGSVYMFGDFNSRVGMRNDYIVHDVNNICVDDTEYEPDSIPARPTIDRTQNSHGIKFTDLCRATGYRILNGRVGDTNKYTFLSHNGCSVIDYLITSERNFNSISEFCIDSFNEWSDHSPLYFSLLCNKVEADKSCHSETRYKWNNTFCDQFRSGLISKLPCFNTIVNNAECSNREAVDTMLHDFTQVISDVADPLFSKKTVYKESVYFNSVSHKNRGMV